MNKLLGNGSVLILLGTGGVGKTTIAAAMGVAAAREGLATALITVDPTQRLRDALGLARLTHRPVRLSPKRLRAAGLDGGLKLAALMLDVKGVWDATVERFARDPAARRRILDNPFYQRLASDFAGADAFAALQQLYDLHQSRDFEQMIVDTPPAAHALDFISAPARFIRLLDAPGARWLFAPGATAGRLAARVASRAARFVIRELERFAGGRLLATITEFFAAAAETVEAVIDRLGKTETLLRSPGVRFVLVTTCEQEQLRQARDLIEAMRANRLNLGAVVINRFADQSTWCELARFGDQSRLRILRDLPPAGSLEASRGGELALRRYLAEYGERTIRDLERVARFARELPPDVELSLVPEVAAGVGDLRALARIADMLAHPLPLARPGAQRDGAARRAMRRHARRRRRLRR